MAASTSSATMNPTGNGSNNVAILPAASAVPLKYSSLLGVGGALQSKNMSSTFVKDDKQSYWTRRNTNADHVLGEMRQKKRARMTDPSEAATRNGMHLDTSHASNGLGAEVKGKGREAAVSLVSFEGNCSQDLRHIFAADFFPRPSRQGACYTSRLEISTFRKGDRQPAHRDPQLHCAEAT